MKKKITKRNFILLAIVAVLLLVSTVISFNIPFTTNIFKGFAQGINLGLDFSEGTRATYTVVKNDYSKYTDDNYVDKAVSIVQEQATKKYMDARVYRLGDDQIVVEVPDTSISSDIALNELEIKTEKSETATTYLNGSHIKSSNFQMNGASYGVLIRFTNEGADLIEDMTANATESSPVSIVFCLGRDYDNALSVSTSSAVNNGYVYFTMQNKDSAKLYAKLIENSKFGITMTADSGYNSTTTIYPIVTTWGKVVVSAIVCLMLIGSFVYLILKYKDMGLISSLALMFYALFNVITLSLIPAFRLAIASYIGLLLGYILLFVTINMYLNNINTQFCSGKKLSPSFKSAYKNVLPTILDIYVMGAGLSLVCLFVTSGFVFSFAFAFIFACAYGALVSLAIMLWFSRMYLKINNFDAKRLNLLGKEATNETK